MQLLRVHAPYDRYTVAFVDQGIAFLAEVEWGTTVSRHRWHDHREMQLLFILEGYMGLEMDGQRHDCGAGTVFRIPALKTHRVFQRPVGPRVLFVDLRLTKDSTSSMVRFLEGLGESVVFSARPEPLRAAAAGLRGALALAGPRRTARVQSALWDMLAEMTAKQETPPAPRKPRRQRRDDEPQPEDLRLQIADSLMRDSVAQPPTVEALAGAAGLSRSQLTRLYKQHHGLGPAERLRQLRIDKARELLASTTLSVKEVAHVCGFVCPNHFCRVFLQMAGVTPSGFRSRNGVSRRG